MSCNNLISERFITQQIIFQSIQKETESVFFILNQERQIIDLYKSMNIIQNQLDLSTFSRLKLNCISVFDFKC